MNQTLYAILTVLFLSGCGTISYGINHAAEANDNAVKSAEFTICYGATVGSIRRAYGSPEKQEIWKKLCNATDSFSPVEPL